MNPEYIKLAKIAFDTVIATMLEGEQTHPENEWQEIDIETHAEHVRDHITDAQYEIRHKAKLGDDDHIGHALTRLAMVKAKQVI